MKKHFLILIIGAVVVSCQPKYENDLFSDPQLAQRVDSVLQLMTLTEKIGQLNQIKGQFSTGIDEGKEIHAEEWIREGKVGSILNHRDLEGKIRLQEIAVQESRLGIPIIFGRDVIHGYRTVFPVPIAQASSWDMAAIRAADSIAAMEATADGQHWTFAPMVDVSRDPRWGRVMEGPGEDPYLASQIAIAMVKGLQQDDLSKNSTILAGAKHFAAYGAAEAGRDYNTVDISEIALREIYLPPFKAAVDAGVGTIMHSFNTLGRIPVTADRRLVRDILKDEWGFDGFTVSDYNSVGELIPHGVAADKADAAELAIKAGCDMDMMALAYIEELEQLVKDGKVDEALIDDAVRRILKKKFQLGLMDDPYLYFNQERRDQLLLKKEHRDFARDFATKTSVLLKNEKGLLPLKVDDYQKIAVIGPLSDSREYRDYQGNWNAAGRAEDVVTLYQALQQKFGSSKQILQHDGCEAFGKCPPAMIDEAVNVAKQADVIICAIGENGYQTGEGASRTDITLPGTQEQLLQALHSTGKPVVMVMFNGRPLIINWAAANIPAILEVWQPGIMGGPAIVDLLFGDVNPSGKLPVSFPRAVGQIPVYYAHLNTGRPKLGPEDDRWGVSKYSDVPNEPLFPFGYGLSYTTFEYDNFTVDKQEMTFEDTLNISVAVKNMGNRAGEEVVQLYIRDIVAQVSRPVKQLKRFAKVHLAPGERKEIKFQLTLEDLKYWNGDIEFVADPGEFKVFAGPNSAEVKDLSFELVE